MLPRADVNSARPLATLEAATPVTSATDPRQDVFRRLTQIAIGRELQVTVDSLLDDGTFIVKVADTTARMSLPTGTKVGDTLNMVFVAREPRPTFLLNQQAGSAPTSLSTGARLLDQLLQSAQQQGASSAVTASAPLLPSPVADPQRLAAAIQDGLAQSGLFYESHLHEWISGSRTLDDIAREPQAKLATADKMQSPLPQEATRLDLGRLANDLRDLGEGTGKLAGMIRDAQLQGPGSAVTDADVIARGQSSLPQIDLDTAKLVNSQINTLEHQQIRWQGELWPGQQMEWEINEDTPHQDRQAGEQSVWNSTVRFDMPHLGEVSASIRLVGDHVHVQVHTPSDRVADTLREHGGLLADRLDAAGSPMDSFLVKRDEQA